MLEEFKESEFSDQNSEKDIEMIVHSLYGILAGETEEGHKSVEKAKTLARDVDMKYEMKQWLQLPLFTV